MSVVYARSHSQTVGAAYIRAERYDAAVDTLNAAIESTPGGLAANAHAKELLDIANLLAADLIATR
jgi:hypothetical protein